MGCYRDGEAVGEDQEAVLRFPQGWSAGQLSCLGCLLQFFVLNNPATCHRNSALDILNTVGENHVESCVAEDVGEGLVLTGALKGDFTKRWPLKEAFIE